MSVRSDKSSSRSGTALDNTKRAVLELLKAKNKPMTARAIAEELGKDYWAIAKIMTVFSRNGQVDRIPAPGHQYQYIFKAMKPKGAGKLQERMDYMLALSSSDLKNFLSKWAKTKWEPLIFSSARQLPYGLARLFELATEASYGSKINQTDLDEIRQNITTFKKDLEQSLRVVNGILGSDIWDANTFAAHLLEDADVTLIQQQAFEAKGKN